MQSLAPVRPRFIGLLNPSWIFTSTLRAFSSASSSANVNQSRGGLPRFFSEVLPPSKGGFVKVQGDEFWHMTKVLRLTTDDRVELFNGKGGLVEGCIQRIDRTALDFVALEDPKFLLPQSPQWHVFAAFGTLKGGRADWLVEKCTELGASSVTPLLTERSSSISENRVDRLERVILAASKQCCPIKHIFSCCSRSYSTYYFIDFIKKTVKRADNCWTRRRLHRERSEYDNGSGCDCCRSWPTSPTC
ncbi:uncharacterized protein LOC107434355 isoform X5 [Ziziphus jujuba]|uniref:16S rRNA (uracil(1498)-N(3))-methyltransferase n=1 Tax=Ziziphus jujuba TaxID=326968 RepID=A0ABM3HZT4_ZIZJJ|nr:uncharacterized protein LOC107434355 isoform X5 [Ziziphus jujuba]